jgi:hypothetical protein
VHVELIKSMDRNYVLDMLYISKEGAISKRRIKVLQVGEVSFRTYCHIRKTNRAVGNVFALVPIISSEWIVV